MANESWHVTVDGAQLPGEYDTARVRELLVEHAGKDLLVWTAGMAEWAEPRSLPQFPAPAPSRPSVPAPAPAPASTPSRRPASPASQPAPAAARAAAAFQGAGVPMTADELQDQAGVFKSLLDTSFRTMLTPRLVKAVYLLLMVVLALAVAGGILTSLAGFAAGPIRGLIGLVIALVLFPFIALLYLAFVRMGLEVVMAVFRIEEHTRALAAKAKQGSTEP